MATEMDRYFRDTVYKGPDYWHWDGTTVHYIDPLGIRQKSKTTLAKLEADVSDRTMEEFAPPGVSPTPPTAPQGDVDAEVLAVCKSFLDICSRYGSYIGGPAATNLVALCDRAGAAIAAAEAALATRPGSGGGAEPERWDPRLGPAPRPPVTRPPPVA